MKVAEPIIVTGADRSGTTLLYALLASHPDLSMVRRTNMWRWFDRRFGDLGVPANLDRCLQTMLRYPRLACLEPDVDSIRAEFRSGTATYGRLFDVFHAQYAERRGCSRWGDKSLHTEHHADRILTELPGARIVHMVRDPRDRHASIVRRYDGRTKGLGATTGRWRSSVRQGRRNLRRHPYRYRVVRYETLACHPVETLRELCAFLHLDYTPAMLGMRGLEHEADASGNSSFEPIAPGTISTRSIGRYASVLQPRQVAVIQALAGRQMVAHGYPLDPISMSGLSRLRFLGLDVPADGTRLAAWSVLDRVDRLRPTGVPAHRLVKAVVP